MNKKTQGNMLKMGTYYTVKAFRSIMPIKIEEMVINLDMYIMLSAQRALLNEVASNLRAMCIDFDNKKDTIWLYFYYEDLISEENINSASCVAGEMAGDFEPTVNIIEQSIQLNSPAKIPPHKMLIFRRMY